VHELVWIKLYESKCTVKQRNTQACYFCYENIRRMSFFCVCNILTEGVLVTKLSGKAFAWAMYNQLVYYSSIYLFIFLSYFTSFPRFFVALFRSFRPVNFSYHKWSNLCLHKTLDSGCSELFPHKFLVAENDKQNPSWCISSNCWRSAAFIVTFVFPVQLTSCRCMM
jgi:hypothetical protein